MIAGFIAFAVVCVIIGYACCVAAGRADRWRDQ